MNCKLKHGNCAADIIAFMQKSCLLYTVASSALLLVLLCVAAKLCWAKASWRVLEFPPNYSVGKLNQLQIPLELYGKGKGFPLAEARGLVKLPSTKLIKFEPSCMFYQHPQCLLKLPADAFDYVELRFVAMTDDENSWSDRMVPYLRHISALRGIDLDGTEVTDKGLATMGTMPELISLSAGNGFITGSCLPALLGCKKLTELRFGGADVNNDSLRYLQNFPQLSHLGLTRVNLSVAGLEHVCKCRGLTDLDIDFNRAIDDKALPFLLKLSKLQRLSVKQSKISVTALESLGRHGLVGIDLPKPFGEYAPSEQRRIRKAFPAIPFKIKAVEGVDSYTNTMFGPMTR